MGSVMSLCTSYNYLIEFTPKKQKSLVGTFFLAFQLLPALAMPLFIVVISDNTHLFLFIGFCLSCAGYFLVFTTLPESPMYLFSKEEYKECQDCLNFIAGFNGLSDRIVDM